MEIRLKTLSESALISSGYVTIATDGYYKVQIFSGFNINVEIDDEFTITMGRIVYKGRCLSILYRLFIKKYIIFYILLIYFII